MLDTESSALSLSSGFINHHIYMKRNNTMRYTGLACLTACSVAISSCGEKKDAAEAPESKGQPVLRFSAIPDQDTTAQSERYAPAAKWLSETLGIKVEFIASSDYGASVDKFVTGDIQLHGLAVYQECKRAMRSQDRARSWQEPKIFSSNPISLPTNLLDLVNPRHSQLPLMSLHLLLEVRALLQAASCLLTLL